MFFDFLIIADFTDLNDERARIRDKRQFFFFVYFHRVVRCQWTDTNYDGFFFLFLFFFLQKTWVRADYNAIFESKTAFNSRLRNG